MAALPQYCLAGSDIWLARVPLICFPIIEYHYPDRVLRQFGGFQMQPQPTINTAALHDIDLRGRHDWDWSREHAKWIAEWDSRRDRIVQMPSDPVGASPDYVPWYQGITRRYVGRRGAMFAYMVGGSFCPTYIVFSLNSLILNLMFMIYYRRTSLNGCPLHHMPR